MRARELMSTPVVMVRPETPVKEVAELMVAHGVSGVPVVDRFDHLVGIVSESDLLRKIEYAEPGRGLPGLLDLLAGAIGTHRATLARTAADLMTSRVVTAGPDASVRELVHLMTVYDINRVPIVDAGRLVGIVTRADILRTLARHDAAITEEVRWRLAHELWIDPERLEINTRDGVVTVAGTVDTRADAQMVKHWVAGTEGVVAVEARDLRYRFDDRRAVVP